ncbi:MAG TPA: hypothetical protein ENJ30_02825, partial [Desulfobulbaceae bacterium]|nr:hypothetical protein [Desulfobulbaceae bacterium]
MKLSLLPTLFFALCLPLFTSCATVNTTEPEFTGQPVNHISEVDMVVRELVDEISLNVTEGGRL